MSASVGNVVYPSDWLEVSRPEALKYLYMKRIMKTREFLWDELPNLELELDRAIAACLAEKEGPAEKKRSQLLELVEFSKTKRNQTSIPLDYSFAAALVQLFQSNEEIISKLKEIGTLKGNEQKEILAQLEERLGLARNWVEKRAPENVKLKFLGSVPSEVSSKAISFKQFLGQASEGLESARNSDEAQTAFSSAAKESGNPKEFFQLCYELLIGKSEGPKIGSLALALGKERSLKRLREFS